MYLTSDFLAELLKYCFIKTSIIELVRDHLKYQYIPTELSEIKKIIKSVITYYETNNSLPTYGYVSQQHSKDIEVQEYLVKVKKAETINIDSLLLELESYIKTMRFQILYENSRKLYEAGKPDEAIELTAKESEEIVRFNLKRETKRFTKLFGDFEENMENKFIAESNGEFDSDKVPTGIREIDEEIYGGVDVGDVFYVLGRSGEGKSTLLKYMGTYAARLGYDVLHIQLEGSKEECYDKYTQVWSALKYHQVKYGKISSDKMKELSKITKQLEQKQRDVYIYAFEMFDEASCRDVRNLILEYYKMKGRYPDEVIVDSVDLLHPGDGMKYGISTEAIKMKKENSMKKLKNIATEFRTRIITVDQADGVTIDKWNDPTFVMTRNNVSGAKNMANAVSYFITINQTLDEKKNKVLRLHFDKLRNYAPTNRTVKIATNLEYGRFYDPKRTKELKNFIEEAKVSKVKGKRMKV